MTNHWSSVLALLFLLAAPATAQEPTLVVENGRVIVGDGTVLERGSVVVSGDRIVSIDDEPIEAPHARRVDAAGKTVLPGLIDTHVHLLIDPRGPFTPDSDYPHRAPWPTEMSDSLARGYVSDGLPQKLRSYLEAGVTTLRSTGDYWPEIVEVQARLASGDLKGPRLEVVGPVFTAPGGHPTQMCRRGPPGGPHAEWCLSHLAVPVDDPGEAREWVRRVAASGVDAIKMVGPQFGGLEDAALIRALAAEAENRGIPALMHISDRDNAFHALSLGIDQFVHAPFVASDTGHDRLMLNFMRHDDVFASSTISIQDLTLDGYRQADRPEKVQEEVQELESRMRAVRIYAQEGLLAFGTDVPMLAPDESLRRETRLLREAGLTRAELLRSMTLTAARALGHEKDLGTLEPRKLADLIVVDGNPLEDLSALENVEVVVKGGEVIVEGERRKVSVRREEVTFESAGLRLAGTLTLPEGPGPHAAVVMIPGGGPRAYDRDYTRPGGFQPFRLLADHLAEEGVASLRYDERGVGGSEGESSRDVTSADYADDARAALAHLRSRVETDEERVGLVGHSEGAHIASLIASSSDSVDFLVLLGAVALSPDRSSLEQMERLTRRGGWGNGDESWVARRLELERRSLEAGDDAARWEELEADWRSYYRELQEVLVPEASAGWLRETSAHELAENTASFTRSGWVQHWMASDPPSLLRGLAVPVLALYGGLDLQVPADLHAGPMWEALQDAPAEPIRVHTLPRANHFFRPAETGALHEVEELESNFVPDFLTLVAGWIRDRL